MKKKSAAVRIITPAPYVRLDLGCGPNKQEGAIGVDNIQFKGVDKVHDLSLSPWPFPDSYAHEAYSSHFVEHLTGQQRLVFWNELYRVLKPGGQARIITPDWSHSSAYGDPTHQWPPMSAWYPLYLNKAWRLGNAPHIDSSNTTGKGIETIGLSCDFDHVPGQSFDEWLLPRSQETKAFATAHYINSARELIITLTSRKEK